MSTPAEEEFLPVTPEEQQALRDILEILFKTRDVDFSHYRETTIMRRLFRRMGLGNFSRYADYLAFIKSSHSEAEKLYGDLLLSYTEFFRDPVVFETLKQTVFPALFESHNAKSPIRIWVPGCSTGEEVYSLAICFLEFLQSQQSSNNIQAQFFGTDLNPDNIDFARAAVYHDKARSSISQHRLDKYFDQTAQGLKVSKHVREMCVFAVQNITQDAPFSNMDMVSCRNVLIYMQRNAQKQLLELFHYSLRPHGYLFLGSAETIEDVSLFRNLNRRQGLFQRQPLASSELRLPSLDQILLDSFTPPCVLVDSGLLIRHFRGQLFPFLQPSAGEATLKLSKMVSESLMPELYLAIEEARKSQQRVTKPSITVTINGSLVSMTITVIPMMCSVAEERCFLILFDKGTDNPIAVNAASAATNEPDSEVARLRQELITTKQHLQSMIEEKDEINQELWASNEEVQSANEELQSVNEEMEAAKEELESSNEELLTLNEELSNKTRELNSEKQALRESEFFFRESQKAASIGSYKADFIADRWESSEILDEIFGIDKDYSRTVQGWLDIVYPDDREMMARHLREEVAINRKPFNREYRIIRKSDGAVRWVYGLGKAEFDIVGNISSLIGTIQDITDLKRTEEALQNSQKLDSLGMLAGGPLSGNRSVDHRARSRIDPAAHHLCQRRCTVPQAGALFPHGQAGRAVCAQRIQCLDYIQ
ncbi:MAG: PAS domain-containing protein [Chitinispirillaceae bacterium]|nr:PAS domain-containing protein [Chitinispirillaceae bacterium]